MRIRIVAIAAIAIFHASVALAEDTEHDPGSPLMAPFCAGCHAPTPGTMMGFLDTVSTVVQAIQMDFGRHKEVLSYDSDTLLKNVTSFDALSQYKGKGFTVNFEERNGRKHATAIVRFDIAQTISEDEKLSKQAFKEALDDPPVAVFDVRPTPMYQAAHVPGAASLPATAVKQFPALLPADRDTAVVLYGPGGCLGPTTSLRVKQLGYTNVRIFAPGFADWSETEHSVTTPQWLRRAIDDELGVIIVDLRPADVVDAGHIRGAVNIPLSDFSASRERFPTAAEKAPIVLYGEGSDQAAQQLLEWGYRAVRVLPIGYARWASEGNPVETGPTGDAIVYDPKAKPGAIRLSEFSRLAKVPSEDVLLIDLRDEHELWQPTIAHAVNIPFGLLADHMETLSADRVPVFFCPTGARAEMAYNLLAQAGKPSRFLEVGAVVDAKGNVQVARQ